MSKLATIPAFHDSSHPGYYVAVATLRTDVTAIFQDGWRAKRPRQERLKSGSEIFIARVAKQDGAWSIGLRTFGLESFSIELPPGQDWLDMVEVTLGQVEPVIYP